MLSYLVAFLTRWYFCIGNTLACALYVVNRAYDSDILLAWGERLSDHAGDEVVFIGLSDTIRTAHDIFSEEAETTA